MKAKQTLRAQLAHQKKLQHNAVRVGDAKSTLETQREINKILKQLGWA